jgi:hypothetical protein
MDPARYQNEYKDYIISSKTEKFLIPVNCQGYALTLQSDLTSKNLKNIILEWKDSDGALVEGDFSFDLFVGGQLVYYNETFKNGTSIFKDSTILPFGSSFLIYHHVSLIVRIPWYLISSNSLVLHSSIESVLFDCEWENTISQNPIAIQLSDYNLTISNGMIDIQHYTNLHNTADNNKTNMIHNHYDNVIITTDNFKYSQSNTPEEAMKSLVLNKDLINSKYREDLYCSGYISVTPYHYQIDFKLVRNSDLLTNLKYSASNNISRIQLVNEASDIDDIDLNFTYFENAYHITNFDDSKCINLIGNTFHHMYIRISFNKQPEVLEEFYSVLEYDAIYLNNDVRRKCASKHTSIVNILDLL